MIGSADDDQVLDAPGDIELPAQEEAEVAGPQVRTLAGPGKLGSEDPLGVLRALPVTMGDSAIGNPDLTHAPAGAWNTCFRMHDHDFRLREDPTARGELAHW